ncbi:hypothetical protein B2J93_2886 [Marssonina coronariae]|uniref:Uncharacterized protein n=1 Tax=Diplocarpon coronariae TaxID=2795749 RepID=A0A218YUR9_9HELO|nr:hypothetical protein B2J93_2886 [Marssonina coronariae]
MDHSASSSGSLPDNVLESPSQPAQSASGSGRSPEWPSWSGSLPPPPPPPPSSHQCRICHRVYERADHLNRHLKSHDNARPYQCHHCQKRFNRVDLLTRHVATHERLASQPGRTIIKRADRAGRACVACAAAKARCGDQKPCKRCLGRNIPCETTCQETRHLQARPCSSTQESASPDSHRDRDRDRDQPGRAPDSLASFQTALGSPHARAFPAEPGLRTADHVGEGGQQAAQPPLDGYFRLSHPFGPGSGPVEPSRSSLDLTAEMLLYPTPSHFNNQNLDFDFLDFNFDDVQLGLMDPTPASGIAKTAAIPAANPSKSSTRASRGHAAFSRSPWLWTPAGEDRVMKDAENLALDENDISIALTPGSSDAFAASPGHEPVLVDTKLRDRMFYLISTMKNFTPRVPDFPSLDILNHVIRAFFVRQKYQVDNWIHVPTLSAPDAPPEFLLALVAAGSTVISIPAIWKMGLVLQDIVRLTVGDLWERKNSSTRTLQPLQAWMLFLDTGMWSGFQRQMEIAESFSQNLITMMRRGGILSSPLDTNALVPKPSDEGQVLEAKWRKWSHRESFKRRVNFHKRQPDELTTLFLATSATEWKAKFPQQHRPEFRALPQMIDIMHEIATLDSLHFECDVALYYTALLHGFWGQIWAYLEACKFHLTGGKPDSVHRLWLTTQHRELCREIEGFKQCLETELKQVPDMTLMTDLFLMILHVSPEELQRFAGKAGEEAATYAATSLGQWASTAHARKAVWHAGQVFRSAAQMPPAGLRDFFAVAVHFAGLTLWAYGHLSPPASEYATAIGTERIDPNAIAVVDGPETRETRAFIAGHLNAPALSSVEASERNSSTAEQSRSLHLRLDEPNVALKIARDLYRSNFPTMDGPLPPLVENIGHLMRGLSSLPDSRFSRCVSPAELQTEFRP